MDEGRKRAGRSPIDTTPHPAAVHLAEAGVRIKTALSAVLTALWLLGMAVVLVVTLALVALAATWLVMNEAASALYAELSAATPPRGLDDPLKNGYFLVLGFGSPPDVDPLRAGYQRWQTQSAASGNCPDSASAGDVSQWFHSEDPADRALAAYPTLRAKLTDETPSLERYAKWLELPFDEWGFGMRLDPDCPHLITTHRLYVLEGFTIDMGEALRRLELDLTAWRAVLARARTWPMKRMASIAVQDDAAVLGGLLARAETDARLAPFALRAAVPLTDEELSFRWPMLHELGNKRRPESSAVVAMPRTSKEALQIVMEYLPMPEQAVLNRYAEYYDAVLRFNPSRERTRPQLYDFARTPPATLKDYLVNPLDNIFAAAPGEDWEGDRRAINETDARLRLAGLAVRVRTTAAQPQDVPALMANAGARYYDPFTDYPMLLDAATQRLYSVGRDGKDDHADAQRDIAIQLLFKPL